MTVPADAPSITKAVFQRSTKAATHILNGVMSVNVQITGGGNLQIKERMTSQQRQHVVKKTEAGLNFSAARAIEIDCEADLSLGCFPA
jgi:hypothetical protein